MPIYPPIIDMIDLRSEWFSAPPDQRGNSFEYAIENLILACCRPGDAAVDIGANCAAHTQTMIERVGKNGVVFSFEPNPKLLTSLRLRAKHYPQMILFECALSDRNGSAEFHVPDDNHGGYGSLSSKQKDGAIFERVVRVPVRRLDDIADVKSETRRISFIKCDAEGEEIKILDGAKDTIAKHRPVIAIEIDWIAALGDDKAADEKLFSPFRSMDYSIFDLFGSPVMRFDPHLWTISLIPNELSTLRLPKVSEMSIAEFFTSKRDWNPYLKLR